MLASLFTFYLFKPISNYHHYSAFIKIINKLLIDTLNGILHLNYSFWQNECLPTSWTHASLCFEDMAPPYVSWHTPLCAGSVSFDIIILSSLESVINLSSVQSSWQHILASKVTSLRHIPFNYNFMKMSKCIISIHISP